MSQVSLKANLVVIVAMQYMYTYVQECMYTTQ